MFCCGFLIEPVFHSILIEELSIQIHPQLFPDQPSLHIKDRDHSIWLVIWHLRSELNPWDEGETISLQMLAVACSSVTSISISTFLLLGHI